VNDGTHHEDTEDTGEHDTLLYRMLFVIFVLSVPS